MKKNMGIADRITRVIIAAIVAVLYFTGVVTGIVGIVLLILAGIFLLTSLFSFCPIYFMFGLKTTLKNE
jgi:fatty acid desaturase